MVKRAKLVLEDRRSFSKFVVVRMVNTIEWVIGENLSVQDVKDLINCRAGLDVEIIQKSK